MCSFCHLLQNGFYRAIEIAFVVLFLESVQWQCAVAGCCSGQQYSHCSILNHLQHKKLIARTHSCQYCSLSQSVPNEKATPKNIGEYMQLDSSEQPQVFVCMFELLLDTELSKGCFKEHMKNSNPLRGNIAKRQTALPSS